MTDGTPPLSPSSNSSPTLLLTKSRELKGWIAVEKGSKEEGEVKEEG